jgi:hypothetical protein
VSPRELDKRLTALEQWVTPEKSDWDASTQDGQPLAWVRWLTAEELVELEGVARALAEHEETGRPYPPELCERATALATVATARMQAGEPDDDTKRRLEREAEVLELRRQGKAGWLGCNAATDPMCDPAYRPQPPAVDWQNTWPRTRSRL